MSSEHFPPDREVDGVLIKPFGGEGMTLLPPAPGLCQECAVDHEPEVPHNLQSLHYQYSFRLGEVRAGREERWPTWTDAMAHCDPEVQALWREALIERGVIFPS